MNLIHLLWVGDLVQPSSQGNGALKMQAEKAEGDAMKKMTLVVTTKIDGVEVKGSGEMEYPATVQEAQKLWGDKGFLTKALRYYKIEREGEIRRKLQAEHKGGTTGGKDTFDLE